MKYIGEPLHRKQLKPIVNLETNSIWLQLNNEVLNFNFKKLFKKFRNVPCPASVGGIELHPSPRFGLRRQQYIQNLSSETPVEYER